MEKRPMRFIAFLTIAVIGIALIGGEAVAGLNPNGKYAVHVEPHASRSCSKAATMPAIASCADIITTDAGYNVDAFPVFYDLTEYQGFDYGLTFDSPWSGVFTSCSDLTIGGVVYSGDGVSHAWTACNYASVAIPGFSWIYSYGMVCIVAHPEAGPVKIGDCHGGDDFPTTSACAGTNGMDGDDPCGQPPVCEVDPTTLEFGHVYVSDTPVSRTFEIRNTGGGLLEGTLSESCDHFEITDPLDLNYSIANGSPLTVTVEYDPTAAGSHDCTIDTGTPCGDDVYCTGEASVSVSVDIRPGECPNDLRVESPFVIPVAILGTAELDVSTIDVSTVRLARVGSAGSVSPVRWRLTDVGTPYTDELCGCHALGGDGMTDLNLKFRISDMVSALELGGLAGQTAEFILSGDFTVKGVPDVNPDFTGADCARIISDLFGEDLPGPGEVVLVTKGNKAGDTIVHMTYSTGSKDHIALEIFDVRGRLVTRLVDEVKAPGTYDQTWNMVNDSGQRVPMGVYFAMLKNSVDKETAKIVIGH